MRLALSVSRSDAAKAAPHAPALHVSDVHARAPQMTVSLVLYNCGREKISSREKHMKC